MCLLISQAPGVTFSKSEISDFVHHNSDGFGIAYGDGETLHLVRMVGSVSEIWDTYRAVAAGKRCILHFRMTTHGETDVENAHPYPVTDDIVIAHNGVLSCGNPVNRSRSDTWHFIEYFLAPIARSNPDMLFSEEWGKVCGKMIGAGNKLAIVHRDGRIALVNESAGVTHKRSWLSNTYAWSAPRKYTPHATAKHYTPSIPAMARHVYDEPQDDGIDYGDYVLSTLWDEAQAAHDRNPVDGLYLWAHNNFSDAVELLAGVSGSEHSEAEEWLLEKSADAITYLMECFEDNEQYTARVA